MNDSAISAHAYFLAGLESFRRGDFFEAHEEWEELWKERAGDERLFLQALIQLAAGCVHAQRGNRASALRLFGAALEKLERLPGDELAGLSLLSPRSSLRDALSRLPGLDAWPELTEVFRL